MDASDDWPYRSLLFTPGHRLDWIGKTPRYAPDAVILDLEDAVPPNEKSAARAVARKGIDVLRAAGVAPFVRVNLDTMVEDVIGVMAKGLKGVCLPKLDNAQQVRQLSDVLSYAEGQCGLPHGAVDIVVIPETAAGLCDVRQLVQASPRVKSVMNAMIDRPGEAVVFQGDTALAAGFIPTQEGFEQIYMHAKICLEARAGGAQWPVGAVIGTDLGQPEATRHIAQRLKAFGFTGCVCIHPSHVAIANEVFGPSPQEVEFHAGVIGALKAAEAKGQWAVNYRGIMIDRANLAIAERVLSLARRYGMQIPEKH